MASERKPYGCIRCMEMKPRSEFPSGRNMKRLSSVCWDCQHDEALAIDARRDERAANAATKVIDGVTWHRCSAPFHEGERWFPWTEEHFYVSRRNPDGSPRNLAWRCKACDSRRSCEQDSRMRRGPEAEQWREARNAAQRKWRGRNPHRLREYQQRWKDRLRQDPERYAEYLADQRITYRLRREAQGKPVREHGPSSAVGAWVPGVGHAHDSYDVEPLALWLEAVFACDGRDPGELAEVMQVDDRALRRVLGREYRLVTLAVADHLVWGYGKAIKMPDLDDYANELAERCREMPGNGERILRYIDLAERIGHLDGAVVDRIEDLWPELA